jgi:outer membrane protein OmpA-like peptidoglycan-associated protein
VSLFSLVWITCVAQAADADLYTVSGATINGEGTPQLEAVVDAAVGYSGGLVMTTASDLSQTAQENGLVLSEVRNLSRLDAGFGWTIRKDIRATVVLGGFTRVDAPAFDDFGGGISDLRLQSTFNLPVHSLPISFALVPKLSTPLTDVGRSLHGGVAGTLTGVMQWSSDHVLMLANMGGTIRAAETLGSDEVGSTLDFMLASAWTPTAGLRVGAEIVETVRITDAPSSASLHLFADAGITSDITLHVATGGGRASRTGEAPYRLVVGLTYGRGQNDQDGDGLVDTLDACPIDAEDFDGLEDTDGCPEVDADGDGVLDEEDTCPLKEEDHDDFESADGCPDPDNDADGVLDVEDQCPLVAGTPQAQGCDGAMFDEAGLLVLLRPIEFDEEHGVKPSSPLSAIASLLGSNEKARILFSVHTDNRPDESAALARTQAQASNLQRALTELGVPQMQIEVEGVGSRLPVDTNRTTQGRENNRRVTVERLP